MFVRASDVRSSVRPDLFRSPSEHRKWSYQRDMVKKEDQNRSQSDKTLTLNFVQISWKIIRNKITFRTSLIFNCPPVFFLMIWPMVRFFFRILNFAEKRLHSIFFCLFFLLARRRRRQTLFSVSKSNFPCISNAFSKSHQPRIKKTQGWIEEHFLKISPTY